MPPTFDELFSRINDDIKYFGGELPERTAIAWRGYLASLLEWEVIPVLMHRKLWDLLPEIEDDPVTAIMIGRGHGE